VTNWTTKTGEIIPIRKMTDSHLANAIACMERVAASRANWDANGLAVFGGSVNGEQAGYAIDAALDALEEHGADLYLEGDPMYEALIAEQDRRLSPPSAAGEG
jgi:hypothetical protein